MDATRHNPPPPNIKYASQAPFGAMDPKERVARLDAEGLVAAFLYPTLGLLYETECDDAELAQAFDRAAHRQTCRRTNSSASWRPQIRRRRRSGHGGPPHF